MRGHGKREKRKGRVDRKVDGSSRRELSFCLMIFYSITRNH